MGRLAILGAVFALLLPGTAFAEGRRATFFPATGVLISGQSLAGVHLGDTPADVEAVWGTRHDKCDGCTLTTWYFTYPDDPVGAAVMFDRTGQAVAVFTLGSPWGWRTQSGLKLGADIHVLAQMYDLRDWSYKGCIGFTALSSRQGGVVTSVLTQAEQVYGFALTLPGRNVCI